MYIYNNVLFVRGKTMKQDPISLGAAAIMGGASLLSGVIGGASGAASQASANKANLQIARENREWQSQENAINRQYQTDMWNATNLYNSPAEKMKRNREAGLNPYLMDESMTQGASAPSTPAMTSAPNAPTMQPVNPLQGLSGGVSSGLNLFLNGMNQSADVQQKKANTLYTLNKGAMEAYQTGGRQAYENFLNLSEPLLKSQSIDQGYFARQMEVSIAKDQASKDGIELQNNITKEFGKKTAQSVLDQIDQQITESVARIGKMASDAKVNEQTIDKLATDMVFSLAAAINSASQGRLADANSSVVQGTKDYIISKLGVEAAEATARGNIRNNWLYQLIDAATDQLGKIVSFGFGRNASKVTSTSNSTVNSTSTSNSTVNSTSTSNSTVNSNSTSTNYNHNFVHKND